MQAFQEWVPPVGVLGQILAETRDRVASLDMASLGHSRERPDQLGTGAVRSALEGSRVAVIAEIKRRSPSRGTLNAGLDAAAQARLFDAAGAAVISILTEPTRFGGSLADLREAAAATQVPLLRKDFHISPTQVMEAARSGASAILLIARALPPRELSVMIRSAEDAGLDAVVEIRTERELEVALSGGAHIIGVNSRDLETLEVDDSVPERLIPVIPADVAAIWESGISAAGDVERAAACGADAVLVGSALSVAGDPRSLLQSLTGVSRQRRRG